MRRGMSGLLSSLGFYRGFTSLVPPSPTISGGPHNSYSSGTHFRKHLAMFSSPRFRAPGVYTSTRCAPTRSLPSWDLHSRGAHLLPPRINFTPALQDGTV